jgi:hypothetical protein
MEEKVREVEDVYCDDHRYPGTIKNAKEVVIM